VTRPRGPPVVSSIAPAGAGQPPVNGGATSDADADRCMLLKTVNRLLHEKTAATAAAARRSSLARLYGSIDRRGTRGVCSRTARPYAGDNCSRVTYGHAGRA
jgi:hypothetical protein